MGEVISYETYADKQGKLYEELIKSDTQEEIDIVINKLARLYRWHIQDNKTK